MTRRHLTTLALLLALADLISAFGVFMLVAAIRFESDPSSVWSVGIDPPVAAAIFAIGWIGVSSIGGLYNLRSRWSLGAEAADIARVSLLMAAITLSVLFLLHQDNVSRVLLVLLFLTQPLAALALRALLRSWFALARKRGADGTRMLVIGTGRLAEDFANRVEEHVSLGVRVIGHLAVEPASTFSAPPHIQLTRPMIGSVDDLQDVFRTHVVDEVAVCLPSDSAALLEPVVTIAASEGKTVRIPRGAEEGVLRGALVEDFDGYLVQSVVHDGQRELERVLKRLLDIVGASIAAVLLCPLLIGSAIAIWLRDGRPILFRQVRIGRHGRPFTIYKFRTMVVDAEQRYSDLAALSDTKGAAFKMTDDPRVTPVGRVLRKWTLDELPQLLNVLKGDMSLVGPRPAPLREVEEYDIWHRRRLSVRPGMTGLWQVEARFDEHFDDRAELDLRYIDQWSIWMDARILLQTLPAVFLRPGK
jgi:exopolysaccharide biosynthesis polyprenyl glycosylphosphotransferase